MVLVWHYIYYNVYITSIKLSISPQSLVVTIWKQFRWAVLALIKMDIARGRVPISDATITTISCPIFSLSGAGTSVVLSFKITVKLKILNLASGASQIDTEKELERCREEVGNIDEVWQFETVTCKIIDRC